MPRPMQLRAAAACATVLCLALAFVASASAAGVTATLRVVGAGDKVVAEKLIKTSDTTVKTSPKAICFGSGTGGSG